MVKIELKVVICLQFAHYRPQTAQRVNRLATSEIPPVTTPSKICGSLA